MWDINDQMINWIFLLSDINIEKSQKKLNCAELFRRYESDPGADFNLFKIAYDYCHDEDLAEEKMREYIDGETTISSLGEPQIETHKKEEDNLITHINVIVQFLTKYAKGIKELFYVLPYVLPYDISDLPENQFKSIRRFLLGDNIGNNF
jgi:hypothetical protein